MEVFIFPYSAIVGQDDAKLALLLCAVDPSIGGALLSGVKGTGKSSIVRAFSEIMPEIEVVKNCPYNCDPNKPAAKCPHCSTVDKIEFAMKQPRVITVPLGATEDRLLGTINVQKVLSTGEIEFQPGLLADANRQVLYIDEVNLLPDNITDDILDVSAGGINRIEREGMSIEHDAGFMLVGTMNPEEGQLRPQILDRFALSVKIETIKEPHLRAEIVKRALAYSAKPEKFCNAFAKVNSKLTREIADAMNNLANVKISGHIINIVSVSMASLGVDGQRPDIVVIKSAIALAALWGDKKVEFKHIEKVSPLAVCHRTRNGGFDEPPSAEDVVKSMNEAKEANRAGRDTASFFSTEQLVGTISKNIMNSIRQTADELKKND